MSLARVNSPEPEQHPPTAAGPSARRPRRVVTLALVFAGGAAGSAAREALTLTFPSSGEIPYATWSINVLGSLTLGLLLGLLATGTTGLQRGLRLAGGTGFCGGFTTYSTLAAGSADLVGRGLWGSGVLYAGGTVLAGTLAAWLGVACGMLISRRRGAAQAAGAVR